MTSLCVPSLSVPFQGGSVSMQLNEETMQEKIRGSTRWLTYTIDENPPLHVSFVLGFQVMYRRFSHCEPSCTAVINSQDGGHFSVPGCPMLLALTLSSCYPDPIFLPQCALPISLCPSGSLHDMHDKWSITRSRCTKFIVGMEVYLDTPYSK